jgi:flagellar biosynthesis regulator FlaF
VLREALDQAKISPEQIDAIAYTKGLWATFILHSPRSGFSRPQDSTRFNHCHR